MALVWRYLRVVLEHLPCTNNNKVVLVEDLYPGSYCLIPLEVTPILLDLPLPSDWVFHPLRETATAILTFSIVRSIRLRLVWISFPSLISST